MKRNSQSGVALIVTLLLLSVITFMAVTLLVVTQHERERTAVQSNQSDAVNAASAAVEQFKAVLMASMLSRTNGYDFGPWVSTNYQSPFGFINSGAGYGSITNVGYTYPNGTPLSGNDLLQSINNLQILPRAPVFVLTNRLTGGSDFRYYLDLNRNGRFDTNGPGLWLDSLGHNLETNHPFMGDPEWISILDKPDQRHSGSNLVVARYAFLALPIGNSLDINYIHNQAKEINPKADGFLRNQGVGTWDINLAAFLYYLNTNAWGGRYDYETHTGPPSSSGTAFDDATSLVEWRFNGNYNNTLLSATKFFGFTPPFVNDYIDEYSAGPLWVTDSPLTTDFDNATRPWPGANNSQHIFTSQDSYSPSLFNYAPNPQNPINSFSNRLYSLGFGNNPYDRYTYYRMLSQLSFDSAPESTNKINLNYASPSGATASTFVPWTPVQFFMNTAEKLLEDLTNTAGAAYPGYFLGSTAYTNQPLYPAKFSINFIPIYPTNYYSSAVHRALQMAANIYDATTNREFTVGSGYPYYPSVFRPLFGRTNDSANNLIIYIRGYVEEGAATDPTPPDLSPPLSLPEQANLVTLTTANIYGIPRVIGAKKGFPNFNEFSMQTFSQVIRKLQVDKGTANSSRANWKTNQLFVIGVSNIVGAEAWNSYYTNYPRQVSILATNDLQMTLTVTNDSGVLYYTTFTNQTAAAAYSVAAAQWQGYRPAGNPTTIGRSFQLPITNGAIFLPDSVYRINPRGLYPTSLNDAFEQTTDFRMPHFVIGYTNRLRFAMVDTLTGRIIDYASFNAITNVIDLTAQIITNLPATSQFLAFWDTNRPSTSVNVTDLANGIINQVQGSMIQNTIGTSYSNNPPNLTANTIRDEINGFNDFINNSANTNVVAQVPFTPTAKILDYHTWQANDPLVHYTLNDLNNFPNTNTPSVIQESIVKGTPSSLVNLGKVNLRYRPWGGFPGASDPATDNNLALKDPGIINSDAWQFPTNKFPNIGWLGAVHRGTPWQTIYLKSTPVNSAAWQAWTGNPDFLSAQLNQPTNDWRLLDLFTTAPNANATRGQLSVNQTNLADWAAVLTGVIVLSNSTTSSDLQNGLPLTFTPLAIDPNTNNPNLSYPDTLTYLVQAINNTRYNNSASTGGVFQHVGDILGVPELTVNSPYLNLNNSPNTTLNDAAYERIPRQIMSLLKVGEPRYVVFAYGQSLKPADRSIQNSGPYFGICTNYQITGEVLTRTVFRVVNPPIPNPRFKNPPGPALPPRIIVESFNVLPPE